ncbi:MAG: helix-turn-helix domain-containing protein [Candidatus Methylacidiphilales bacterium]
MKSSKKHKEQQRNIIGRRVREARFAQNPSCSQDDLAGRLAVHGIVIDRSAVSRLEREERYAMDFEVLALAKVLNVSVAWLYGEK